MAVGAPVESGPRVTLLRLQAVLAFSSPTNSSIWLSKPSPSGTEHHVNEIPSACLCHQQRVSLAPDMFDHHVPDGDAMSACIKLG